MPVNSPGGSTLQWGSGRGLLWWLHLLPTSGYNRPADGIMFVDATRVGVRGSVYPWSVRPSAEVVQCTSSQTLQSW